MEAADPPAAERPRHAPIIVAALFGAEDFAYLDGLRQLYFPPERNQLSAHLTMFHHLPPSAEAEIISRLVGYGRQPPPLAELSGVMNLGRGVAFRIRSPGLETIRQELAYSFGGLLTPQDAGGWRPHVTIQNKASSQEARDLLGLLSAGFVTRDIKIAGLAAYHYLGGPWSPIGRYMFRGPR